MDLNPSPLVLEVTALSNAPQQLLRRTKKFL